MMWSEFIEGTGCKDTEHNYEVFQNLEILYSNSEMTKQQIYEYGKKLVDNSKTERELETEAAIRETIQILRDNVAWLICENSRYTSFLDLEDDADKIRWYKTRIRENRIKIRDYKDRIRLLKTSI